MQDWLDAIDNARRRLGLTKTLPSLETDKDLIILLDAIAPKLTGVLVRMNSLLKLTGSNVSMAKTGCRGAYAHTQRAVRGHARLTGCCSPTYS